MRIYIDFEGARKARGDDRGRYADLKKTIHVDFSGGSRSPEHRVLGRDLGVDVASLRYLTRRAEELDAVLVQVEEREGDIGIPIVNLTRHGETVETWKYDRRIGNYVQVETPKIHDLKSFEGNAG